MNTFTKILRVILIATAVALSFSSFTKPSPPEAINVTVKELVQMPVKKLIQANNKEEVTSCVISLEDDQDIVEFPVRNGKEPGKLKSYFSKVIPGQKIAVDKRIAIAEGKTRKLPPVVYLVVRHK
jgi:hypothetical protein